VSKIRRRKFGYQDIKGIQVQLPLDTYQKLVELAETPVKRAMGWVIQDLIDSAAISRSKRTERETS
jgi:hypothetical protein